MKKIRLQGKTSLFAKSTAPSDPGAAADDIATRRIILQIAGDSTTDPAALGDSLSLKDNLQFNDNEYRLLQSRLDEYVRSKKKDQSVSTDEAAACDTVGDCVSLTEAKLH